MHHRFAPREHRFHYDIFLVCLDLDELGRLPLRLLRHNRRGLYSLRDDDHLGDPGRPLRENLEAFLQREGVTERPARVRLLTLPRFLGHVFNPVSFYFCERADGSPLCAVAEVGNTFGERKPYLVRQPLERHPGFEARVPKHFYVSPFLALDDQFHFHLPFPGERLALQVDNHAGGARQLHTTLTGWRRELTDGALLRETLRVPFVTLRVIAGIHWEAFRLWLKRVPWHRKAADPHLQTGVERPHPALRDSKPVLHS
jgi:hypothetical protein